MVLAAEGVPGLDVLGGSVLGVVVLLVLLGWLWAKPAVDGLKADKERAEAQRDALIEAYQSEIIPALRDANAGAARLVQVVEEVRPLMVEVKTMLGRRRS